MGEPVKRRRVMHNYRQLSKAGYMDDYNGKDRFSRMQMTASAGKTLSVLKSEAVDTLSGESLPHCASQVRRCTSTSETVTNANEGKHV